jgi:hypothetical protein
VTGWVCEEKSPKIAQNRPKSPKIAPKRPKAPKSAQNVAKPVFDRTFSTRAHYVGENLANLVTLHMTQKHYGLQKARSRFYETVISSQTEPELLSPQKNWRRCKSHKWSRKGDTHVCTCGQKSKTSLPMHRYVHRQTRVKKWKILLWSVCESVEKSVRQCCQMVYFKTKSPSLGIFWRALEWKMLVYFLAIGYNLWQFVYVPTAVWCSLWSFGIYFPYWYVWTNEISGNPGHSKSVKTRFLCPAQKCTFYWSSMAL